MSRDWGGAVWFGAAGNRATSTVNGHRVQSRVLGEYNHFFEELHVFLHGQPADALRHLEESDQSFAHTHNRFEPLTLQERADGEA